MQKLPQLFLFSEIYALFEILEKLLSVRHFLFCVVLLSSVSQSLGHKAVLCIKKNYIYIYTHIYIHIYINLNADSDIKSNTSRE